MGKFKSVISKLQSDVRDARRDAQSVASAIDILCEIQDGVPIETPSIDQALDTVIAYYKNQIGIGKRNFGLEFFRDPETRQIGALLSATWQLLYKDDLITVPEAACILIDGLNRDNYTHDITARTYMHNMFERLPKSNQPYLTLYYVEPTLRGRRVRRSEAITLREQKSLKGILTVRE